MFLDGSVKAISSASEARVCRRAGAPGHPPATARSNRKCQETEPLWPRPCCSASVRPVAKQVDPPKGRPPTVSHSANRCGRAEPHKCTAGVPAADCSAHSANFNRFPCNGFTYCLTLFSKCFSSFPHGTCSLSVSCQYLALDEIYHQFWAAFPNNPTLRKCLV